jgi:zinc and cadmium transporter
MVLLEILVATFVVSAMSLVGVLTLSINDKHLHSMLYLFVGFSAGALLAAAFFDLLPEGIKDAGVQNAMALCVVGIVMFFVVEKLLHWHHHHKHHHKGERTEAPFTYLNLIGDGVHNFVDGAVIAASFLQSPSLGIVTTLAIMAHEIPQEIGDFSLLIYGGFTKKKALMFNYLSSLTALLGAVLTYYFAAYVPSLINILVPIAAGNFIYLACADLVPEMHKETGMRRAVLQLCVFVAGIALIGYIISTLGG